MQVPWWRTYPPVHERQKSLYSEQVRQSCAQVSVIVSEVVYRWRTKRLEEVTSIASVVSMVVGEAVFHSPCTVSEYVPTGVLS
jgi:hypothetical protein